MEKQNVDFHRLELRYGHLRIKNEGRVRRLADSISRHGQLEAMVAVLGQDGRAILIDGYQRLAALKYLGQDTGLVTLTGESESQALYQLLIHRGERHWEAIEEAGLIQELHRRFDCSFNEIGSRIGRDKSYVKRRLDLLELLPEEILAQIMAGVISTWAANRVLVPLARANAADAIKLAGHLAHTPVSTRELRLFYDHYLKSNRPVRERMLAAPALFIKSCEAVSGNKNESPEEKWLRDAKVVCAILDRLRDKADTVFYARQEKKLRRQLLIRAAKARKLAIEMTQKIKECLKDDSPHQRTDDPGNGQRGHENTDDRPAAEGLPEHRGQGT